jgi:hypothetical protein
VSLSKRSRSQTMIDDGIGADREIGVIDVRIFS